MARFTRRGVTRFLWLTTVAGARPTRAELTAGEDITDYVADVSGWMLENNEISTPDMGSDFDSSIPGTDSAQSSSITVYEDEDNEDIDEILPKGASGYFVILRKGDKPLSKSMDTFPARVGSKAPEITVGNDPAREMIRMSITKRPDLDGTIPSKT